MYVHTYPTYIYIRMCIHILRIYAYVCAYTSYVCTYIHILRTYTYVCAYISYVYMHMYVHTHPMYVCTYISYVRIRIYVRMYVHIYHTYVYVHSRIYFAVIRPWKFWKSFYFSASPLVNSLECGLKGHSCAIT